jgi:hypothetical protein
MDIHTEHGFTARMREDVRRAIAAQLEKFVVAYRSVNPK